MPDVKRGTGAPAAGRRSFGPLLTTDGRLRFLDLARGLAIVFMVFQHVQLLFAVGSGEDSLLGATFLLLGTAPAAPVFMVAMGFLFGSSTRTGVRSGVVRGLQLFALGYALNLLRFVLPLLVRGDPQAIELFGGTWWGAFFEIDILQLAGLSLIVLGPVKRHVRDPRLVLALAAAVAVVSPLLWGVGGGSVVLDPLWGLGEWVSFPLFPWLAYPLLGLSLAGFAARATSAGGLMRAWALAGAAAVLAGAALVVLAPVGSSILAFGDYYRSGLPVQLLLAGFVLLWLPLLWWLDRRLTWRAVPRYLTSLSRNITAVYLIQWALIGWLAIGLGVFDQPSWLAALLGVPILVASHLLALGFGRLAAGWRGRGRPRAATASE
ncbi:MAG: heparan-alpha-glucosaminide N-acetyltransferase domain-containing protein [Actinobacteria bacterium]|nr:heparan-alpha-glucosaminide N-acetyltransferase domain-containing protein [Actinomycetota bacterium]